MVRGEPMILTLHVPPLAKGQGRYDIDRIGILARRK